MNLKRFIELLPWKTESLEPFSTPAEPNPTPVEPISASAEPISAPVESFSINALLQVNPGLARHYLWGKSFAPVELSATPWMHLGCGVRVLDGFVNLDIVPQDTRVFNWNLLDLWPDEITSSIEGVFSEDCIEHFYFSEQIYIFCNINRSMKIGGVARILMPNLSRVVTDYITFPNIPAEDFLHGRYGVKTGADILNYGMRYTGHRWFHDSQSLESMAAVCGLEAISVSCANSNVSKFNGINLRDESESFATEMRKIREITRILLPPLHVSGAKKIEDISTTAELFFAEKDRPIVEYRLPNGLIASRISCINFRSSNLSAFHWCLKTLVLDEANVGIPWYFDETLKSQSCMNLITMGQIKLALGGATEFSRLRFSPAEIAGEYFTIGCAEVFLLD